MYKKHDTTTSAEYQNGFVQLRRKMLTEAHIPKSAPISVGFRIKLSPENTMNSHG